MNIVNPLALIGTFGPELMHAWLADLRQRSPTHPRRSTGMHHPAARRRKGLGREVDMSIQTPEMAAPAVPVIESKLTLPRVHAGTLRRARLS